MLCGFEQTYSQELDRHLHRSQGLLAVKMRDLFPLFWAAWSHTMRPELNVPMHLMPVFGSCPANTIMAITNMRLLSHIQNAVSRAFMVE